MHLQAFALHSNQTNDIILKSAKQEWNFNNLDGWK